MKEKIFKPYKVIIALALLAQILVFAVFGENSYLQVQDDLDLFVPHFQMLKNNHAFFAHGVTVPMIGGLSRDLFGSEFSLYNIMFAFLPSYVAYMIGYFLKIFIGMFSMMLLAKEVYGERYERYKPIVAIVSTAYGMIPVFPTYGIAFTSVPFIIWLIIKLYKTDTFVTLHKSKKPIYRRILLYIAVFCYPILSYFSYHGFFILCYMCLAVIILWIKDKRFPMSTFVSVCVLALGYVTFEYRLFGAMLFDDTVTIRSTMVHADVSFGEAMRLAYTEFLNASFHCEDSHTYIILPVVLIGVLVINIRHIIKGEGKKCFREPVNLCVLVIIFNCLVCGMYSFKPFRDLLETLVSKLTGFDFSRTSFFNPVLWYMALACVCIYIYDNLVGKWKGLPCLIATFALAVVMLVPQMYNNFYINCYNQAYKLIKHKDTSTLNYREFYSEDFFDEIKTDMEYSEEWVAAYGLHPGVLVYNGFATLDGYLGMYSQEYKDKWTEVEAPAFEGSPYFKMYFEEWGARVCLYSGSDENTYDSLRIMDPSDKRLMANTDLLKEMDCKYILSRVKFDNEDEAGVELTHTYTDENGPYTIYVYSLK